VPDRDGKDNVMADKNLTILTGALVSATERSIGQAGRSLVELRLGVTRPVRRGEAESPRDLIPVTIWSGDLGAAVLGLAEGTPCTVVARVGSREWNGKLYLELIAESVTIDAAAGGAESPDPDSPREVAPKIAPPPPRPDPFAPARPGPPTRKASAEAPSW